MTVDRRLSAPFPDQDDAKPFLVVLTICNAILAIAALGLCGLGLYCLLLAQDVKGTIELLTDMPLVMVAYIIMLIGAISAVACFAGFYGAYTDNDKHRRTGLYSFLFFVFAGFLILLCMSIFLYLYGTKQVLNDIVRDRWFEEGQQPLEKRIDYQDYFECCGWETPFDSRASGYSTPCPRSNPESCLDSTLDFFETNFLPLSLFGLVLGICQFLAVVATVLVLRAKKKMFDDFETFEF
mmetsp:Transcript_33590/g.46967  ORF Transcript_33590/g.46967 Transcript_33590/m.46967 type:complete len:238 (+) Transcript_33590:141-854(+)